MEIKYNPEAHNKTKTILPEKVPWIHSEEVTAMIKTPINPAIKEIFGKGESISKLSPIVKWKRYPDA